MKRDVERRIVRGAFAGLIAGVVASFAMDRFQAAAKALSSGGGGGEEDEPSTQRAADAVSKAATGNALNKVDKPLGGQAMHYLLGTGLGIAYGVAAEFVPAIAAGGGTLFGAGTTLVLDEALVPAAGLADPPTETPPATHAFGLVSHLVFGGVAEFVRRQLTVTFEPD